MEASGERIKGEESAPEPALTLADLAARMPGFSPAAVEGAVAALIAAGVLARETGSDGEERYRYTHPERYRMIDLPVVKQPGPEFGKR
jgi:hypothetical protein